jgi:hypothetical protein
VSEEQNTPTGDRVDLPLQKAVRTRPRLTVKDFLKPQFFHARRLRVKGGDPNYHYRKVRNNPESVEYREEQGFEVVPLNDPVSGGDLDPAGGIRTFGAGRYVLMRRHMDLHEAHLEALRRKTLQKSLGPRRDFEAKARSMGVETMDKTRVTVGPPSLVFNEPRDEE